MNPINSWLDPSEVRHLADQLIRPISKSKISTTDPGFDSTFVGFMNPETASSEQEIPEQVSNPVDEVESKLNIPIEQDKLSAPFSRSHLPPPRIKTIPDVTLAVSEQIKNEPTPIPVVNEKRANIFRNWLFEHFKAREVFILNREGKVIFEESSLGRLYFIAKNFAASSRQSGNIRIKIGPVDSLELISCESANGYLILGAIMPVALQKAQIETIVEEMKQAALPV